MRWMPDTDEKKPHRHSHPQNDSNNQNEPGDSRKRAKGTVLKESFGNSGAMDSHRSPAQADRTSARKWHTRPAISW